jgi:type II pantothenate kinase
MRIIVGIDVGGSTTKIVGFDGDKLFTPILVKATDPIASVYGGFGKFTSDNNISLKDIDKVMVTGVGSAFIGDNIYGIETVHINEFTANGKGGLYLSGIDEAVVVSMGNTLL